MNTREIMELALSLAGLEKAPADSVISVEGENIKKIIMGVDMDTPELMLAKQMGYDLVISHHPKADAGSCEFHKVMDIQIDKMVASGVPINKAQKVLRKKVNTISIGDHVGNYDRTSSAAKLLNMPYMNIHLPADLIGERFTQEYLDGKFLEMPRAKVGNVIEALLELDIYKNALVKPLVRCGSATDYAGKILVLFAGGTNGGADVYKAYFEAGVGTIVAMHCPEDVLKAVAEQNIGNIIVAGHMPSDSIGLNVIAHQLKEQGMDVTKMFGILE